jgi:hypothetical protein
LVGPVILAQPGIRGNPKASCLILFKMKSFIRQ